ncbi:MAG: class I SAM-dependent methyltransferase [Desulfomonile tiedjei]|nr:class I SAM-dependent methyltransferase [Desulfomonile tiedjei]
MAFLDFISVVHKRTKRDYVGRVNEYPKAEAAKVAKQFGYDYWDGDRNVGYGGYRYDGRWLAVAEAIAQHYGIKSGDRILDVGCGKGFLLYEFTRAVPGVEVAGIDISAYAIENSKEEVRPFLRVGHAKELPYESKSFDLVISVNTLHNLKIFDLFEAFREIERVGRGDKFTCVESYRNEEEKVNLLYWQLTCESFFSPEEWDWIFEQTGYTGDHGFIYFE